VVLTAALTGNDNMPIANNRHAALAIGPDFTGLAARELRLRELALRRKAIRARTFAVLKGTTRLARHNIKAMRPFFSAGTVESSTI
jgi:hypothetical protein